MGKGAQLNNSMRVDDPSMNAFQKLLLKNLQIPHKEDKFMVMKLKRSKIKMEQIEAERKKLKKK